MQNEMPRILIVDGESATCDLLGEILTSLNYSFKIVSSAQAALDSLTCQGYDLVLIDIRLPDISGLALLRQVGALYPATPIIMLSAGDDLTNAVESLKSGALDYLSKPFEKGKMQQAIQMVLNKKQPPQVPDSIAPPLNEIEAIALGVETRQDILDVHSEKVIQQTIAIARQMGLSEEKIQQWVAFRNEEKSRKIKQVTDSFAKLV